MSSSHYDIAIIGGSLSARIAGTLLAKQGSKVLFLNDQEKGTSSWLHSSLFLEKLLGILGGRSCFVAQTPIQVLSKRARIRLDNDLSLDDELNREFGSSGPDVSQWLEKLREQGELLENTFWEHGGLPWASFKATARFKLLCLRRKVNWAELDAPISETFSQLPETAVTFVTDLLQGLALKRIEELSRAQAAMLWAQTLRPENLKEPDFSDLLSKRFEQFHGLKAPLDELETIHFNGSSWIGGRLSEGRQFTATAFLLGDTRLHGHFNPGKIEKPPLPPVLCEQKTDIFKGKLSPLLATRVICGGEVPLRLAIEEQEDQQRYGVVTGAGERDDQDLRKQLEPALPFIKYTFAAASETETPGTGMTATSRALSLTSLPLQIGSNLYCADSSSLLPEMGAAGAALLGLTLAKRLADEPGRGEK